MTSFVYRYDRDQNLLLAESAAPTTTNSLSFDTRYCDTIQSAVSISNDCGSWNLSKRNHQKLPNDTVWRIHSTSSRLDSLQIIRSGVYRLHRGGISRLSQTTRRIPTGAWLFEQRETRSDTFIGRAIAKGISGSTKSEIRRCSSGCRSGRKKGIDLHKSLGVTCLWNEGVSVVVVACEFSVEDVVEIRSVCRLFKTLLILWMGRIETRRTKISRIII